MKADNTSLKIGDSVKVKPGVLDPDTGALSLEGWQGRIVDIRPQEEGKTLIDIEWDSRTLREMPKASIDACEEEGLSWTLMALYAEDLVLTTARDTPDDVKRAREELETAHIRSYTWLGEPGKRIQQILAGVDPDDEMEVIERWGEYLEQHLSFPFDAVVDEFQERGPLRDGDKVSVKRISLVDDFYGIIVELRRGRKKYDIPLCELAATNKQSPNAQLIQDYRVWFANR